MVCRSAGSRAGRTVVTRTSLRGERVTWDEARPQESEWNRHLLAGPRGADVRRSWKTVLMDRLDDDVAPLSMGIDLWQRARWHDLSGLSAELAYRFLFALFPFGLFL